MARRDDPGIPEGSALGMVEAYGLVAAVEAADAMLKAAGVRLVRQQRTVPALITHFVVGDTAAVRAAVDAAEAAVSRIGRVVATHVIPRPAPDVWRTLVGVVPGEVPAAAPQRGAETTPASPEAASGADAPDYAAQTVRELRDLARARDDERLSGRAVSKASKAELIAFLRETDA